MTRCPKEEVIRKSVLQRISKGMVAFSDQRGAGLVESLLAVAIVGITLVAFLAALSTGSMAVRTTDKHVTAENLARSQMEDIMGKAYAASYGTIAEPDGYDISITIASVDGRDQNEIQKINVEVTYDDDTITLETYKVSR